MKNSLTRIGILAALSLSATAQDPITPPTPDQIPKGFMLYQGDIMLPEDFFEKSSFTTNIWPSVVPYEWDANVSPGNQALMRTAMDEVEGICTVFFVPRAGHSDYLHVQNNTFNSSQVGRVGGGQNVNIVSWGSRYIIIHELMHALGFWHEQSRADRDGFVQINSANISQTACSGSCDSQFQIEPFQGYWGAYDFDSLMHYGRTAFSANGLDTITVLPPFNSTWQNAIGQRTHTSELDQLILSFMYREPNWRFARLGSSVELGTFFLPFATFQAAEADVPAGGRIILLDTSVTYSVVGTFTKAVTVDAPLGGVVLR